MAKFENPLIIAMKGHPGTGKSTLAHSIASSLKIPLLDKDDIRDSTLRIQTSFPTSTSLLNQLSYNAIWHIASTQLRLGLSVVVDSPLSRRAQFDRLIQLASSVGARLLIVECKPKDEAEWKRRLELRGGGDEEDDGWHKPRTWQDLERLLEGYGGCTEYDVGDVPKMVVDTTGPLEFEELCSNVRQFVVSHAGGSVNYHESSNTI